MYWVRNDFLRVRRHLVSIFTWVCRMLKINWMGLVGGWHLRRARLQCFFHVGDFTISPTQVWSQ